LQDVDLNDLNLRLVLESEGECRSEVAIQFECDESTAAWSEDVSNRTLAGADFDERTLAHVAESICDSMAGAIVYKEVLSEFWLTFHRSVTL